MGDAPDYALSYDQKQKGGYDYKVCMWCRNKQMEATSSFVISQDNKCNPSYGGLAKIAVVKRDVKDFPEDADKTENVFVYENDYSDVDTLEKTDTKAATITEIQLGFNTDADYSEETAAAVNKTQSLFFTNADSGFCSYSKCEILAKGCEAVYTQTPYLTLSEQWTVNAQVDVYEGYNTTFCYKCFNGWDSIQQDDIMVVQHHGSPNWTVILVIIFILVLIACVAGSFFVGKKSVAPAKGADYEMGAANTERTDADTARTEK